MGRRILRLFAVLLILLCSNSKTFAYQLLNYKWSGATFEYYINPTGVDNSTDYSSKTTTLRNAAEDWTNISTASLTIDYKGTTTDETWADQVSLLNGQNTITWKTNGWSGSVIGIAITWSGGGLASESDIKLNTSFANDSRLPQLVKHEVGHSLGIGHTREASYGGTPTDSEYNAIMYWQLHTQTGFNKEDKCAITALYPASGACSPSDAEGYYTCLPCCSGEGVTVTITNNSYTYNGSARAVTVSTDPSVSYTVTYYDTNDDVVASPTDAGLYDVVVDITEAGYESEPDTEGTLTIAKATLHVYADNKEIDCGDAQPTYTFTYGSFQNSEDENDLTTEPSAYTTGGWPKDPGLYDIYVSGGIDDNYTFSYHTGTLTINGFKVISVWASNTIQTYDGTSKNIGVITNPAGLDVEVAYEFNSNPVASPINVGIYDVTITITEDCYDQDQFVTELEIEKAALDATADDKTVDYGDTEPTYTISYTGFENSETSSVLNTQPTADVSGTWPLVPGTYAIEVSGGSDNNYDITRIDGTLTVNALTASVEITDLSKTYDGAAHNVTVTTTPPELTYELDYFDSNDDPVTPISAGNYTAKVTITEPGYNQDVTEEDFVIWQADLTATANDVTSTYGDNEPSYTVSYSGFVNGEGIAQLTTQPIATIAETWPVLPGTYNIIPAGGVADNYEFVYVNGELTVESNSNVTISITNIEHTYDGTVKGVTVTTTPSGLSHNITYYDSEQNTVSNLTNAGTYSVLVTITEPGYDAVEEDSPFTINKAELTVSADNEEVNYNDPEPSYSVVITGYVNGETAANLTTIPTAIVGGNWPKLPDTYNIDVLAGTANNYSFSYIDGILTVNALVATNVTISENVHVYDGTSKGVTATTVPAGLDLNIEYFDSQSQTVQNPINAGVYDVKATITQTGYQANEFFGILTIQKSTLSIDVQDKAVVYGQAEPSYSVDISGFESGETYTVIDVPPTAEVGLGWPIDAGTYSIVASGGTDNNYNFVYENGQLIVEKAELTVTVDNKEVDYGDPEPTYTYSIAGFEHGQNSSVLSTEPSLEVNGTWPLYPGEYPIVATGAAASNYEFTYINGTLSVESNSNVSVSFSNLTHVYDGTAKVPEITVEPAGINYEVDYFNSSQEVLTEMINAGNYTITVTITESGYAPIPFNNTLLISKAMLTATALDVVVDYNASEPIYEVEISGYVNNEDEGSISQYPTAIVAGDWPLLPGICNIDVLPGEANNYTFTLVDGELFVNELEVSIFNFTGLNFIYTGTAQEITFEFDAPSNVDFCIDYQDDLQNPIIGLPVNAGTYSIAVAVTQTGYKPDVFNAEMIIAKKELSVSINDIVVTYGAFEEDANVIFNFEGFVINENFEVIDQLPTYVIPPNIGEGAGTYAVELTGGIDNNYSFIYTPGSLTIEKATLIVTALNQQMVFSEEEPEYTFEYDGFQYDETASVLNTSPTTKVEGNRPLVPGSYPIVVSGGDDNNYNFEYMNGELNVHQFSNITLEVTAQNRLYNGNPFELNISTTPENLNTSVSFAATNAPNQSISIMGLSEENAPVDVGVYIATVTIDQLGYEPVEKSIEFKIEQVELTATANDVTVFATSSEPAYTVTYEGFVNNEDETILDIQPTAAVAEGWPLDPAEYTIVVSGGADNNYNITRANGTLTVEPSNVQLSVSVQNSIYNGLLQKVEVTTNPENIAYSVEYSSELGETSPLNADQYTATVRITEPGYSPLEKGVQFSISKAQLQIIADDKTIVAGENEPEYTLHFSGFVNGETRDVLAVQPTVAVNDAWPLVAGEYNIVPQGAEARNYSFAYANGTLTILQVFEVKATAGENGFVRLGETGNETSEVTQIITEGESSSAFYAIANLGYEFEKWDNEGTENPISFNNVQSDIQIGALFKLKTSISFYEVSQLIGLKVYPNPVAQTDFAIAKIEANDLLQPKLTLVVNDLLGRTMITIEAPKTETQISGLKAGVYSISLLYEGRLIKNSKLIIKKK